MPLELRTSENCVVLTVRVKPRASKTRIVGERMGMLEVAVAAPPVDGAANAELIATLARGLGVAKNRINIVSGDTSRTKRISVRGVTKDQVLAAIS